MEIAILFWTMMLAACGYGFVLGGWEGKATTLVFVLASLATIASNRWVVLNWHQTNMMVLVVDFLTLSAMYLVAARSRRWWPLWVAAFQLNSVTAHIATVISPQFSNLVYQGYEGLWAIPSLLVMVIGVWRDRLWKYRYEFA